MTRVRKPRKGEAKVRMIHSVGEHVAGEQVVLPEQEADRFVLLGYAEGELSRDYDEQEQQVLRANRQEVSV